ncbi:MAG: hypothetical protein ACRD4K_04785 [Candidatus Acidiferrales bacterium]
MQQQQRAQEQERQRHSQPVYTTSSQRGEHHAEQREIWQRNRASNWQSDHHEWRERGGYHGYRIPENRYRGYFGPSHFFRLSFLPVVYVSGRPRFEYEGYWFVLEDPWPPEWSDDWYDSDDMYVEYFDDGYYLCDHRHPGYRVAISVFVG